MYGPIPDEAAPEWRTVILDATGYEFEFLALRILLGRVAIRRRDDVSESSIELSVRELRGLFERNLRVPSAQRDLARIFAESATIVDLNAQTPPKTGTG